MADARRVSARISIAVLAAALSLPPPAAGAAPVIARPAAGPPPEIQVAAAANLMPALRRVGPLFEATGAGRLVVSYGSTGKLFAQIESGAPFEVFLAADAERPRLLEQKGETVAGSRFTYARGRLVLWSGRPGLVDSASAVRALGEAAHVALANPKTAPYGEAARQTLVALGAWEAAQPKLVFGEDVGQAFQFVASRAAELGFASLAQIRAGGDAVASGSSWIVPERLYAPLDQQAVLLKRGERSKGAAAFLAFLRSPATLAALAELGYGAPPPDQK